MKKRKFNILLNIATLCLCITAIAFGVYSAKTASLNVSGTIGFTAHNVKAKIEGFITNYADSADGAIVTTDTQIIADGGLALNGGDASFNLGATKGTGTATRYFSDLGTSGNPEDIIVKIKITNTSDFDILVNVDMANCKATTTELESIIKVDYDKSAVVLAKNDNATFTFNVKLLPNSDGSYGNTALTTPTSNNIQLKMNLEKSAYTQSQVKTDATIKQFTTAEVTKINSELSITNNKSYANVFPYYVEMGEVNNEKVKWLIVGTSTKDSDNKDQITALTDSDKTPLSQGYMLQDTTYVMLSEKVLYTNNAKDYKISFQNKYVESGDCLNDYGYAAQDYATSNIRAYLTGKSVYAQSTKTNTNYEPNTSLPIVNIMTTYNLETDLLYEKIKGRTLKSLYNEPAASGNTKDMLIVPTSKTGFTEVDFTGDTQDKLWLMSYTEYHTLLKFTNYTLPFNTTVIGGGVVTDGIGYFLRSPYIGNDFVLLAVNGGNPSMYAAGDNRSLRPAFLF